VVRCDLLVSVCEWRLAEGPTATEPAAPPAFRTGVDLVRAEASVLDKDRRPVRDLTAADFSVRENGQERPIVVFSPVDLPAAAPATVAGGWLRDAPRDVVTNDGADTGRLIVIAFDWSIRIPDFKQAPLAMSGVLVHVAPEEPGVPRSEIDGALPFVPTARRSFAASDTVSAFVQVSQGTERKGALQPVTLRLRIDDAQATARVTQTGELAPAQFSSHRTANARLTLPLRELPPGRYLLTLEAAFGEHRVERLVRFELR
jgi:hypothetical protein